MRSAGESQLAVSSPSVKKRMSVRVSGFSRYASATKAASASDVDPCAVTPVIAFSSCARSAVQSECCTRLCEKVMSAA